MAGRDNDDNYGLKRPLNGGSEYGGAKRPRSSRRMSESGGDRVELRLLIPSSSAGAIIGKGGSNIRELRQTYHANIQIPDSRAPERVVNISASSVDDLGSVCGKIVAYVNGEQPPSQAPEASVLVHQSQAGSIIGRGGSKVKELRESTGAAIKIFEDCLPGSTDRTCQVRGDNYVIVECVKKIIRLLESTPPKGPIQPYSPDFANMDGGYMRDGDFRRGGGRFGGESQRGGGDYGGRGRGDYGGRGRGDYGGRGRGDYGGRGRGSRGRGGPRGREGRSFRGGRGNFYGGRNDYHGSDDNFGGGGSYSSGGNFGHSNNGRGSFGDGGGRGGPETSTKVTIPTMLTGAIIGKGGQRIRQIRQDCGAQIKIDEPEPGSNDRVITITGTEEQIQNAQFLLQKSVRMHSGEY